LCTCCSRNRLRITPRSSASGEKSRSPSTTSRCSYRRYGASATRACSAGLGHSTYPTFLHVSDLGWLRLLLLLLLRLLHRLLGRRRDHGLPVAVLAAQARVLLRLQPGGAATTRVRDGQHLSHGLANWLSRFDRDSMVHTTSRPRTETVTAAPAVGLRFATNSFAVVSPHLARLLREAQVCNKQLRCSLAHPRCGWKPRSASLAQLLLRS